MNLFMFLTKQRKRKSAKVDTLPMETSFDAKTEAKTAAALDTATEKQALTDSREDLLEYLLDEGILTEEELRLMIN